MTLYINLYGGPGCGKSTTAAAVFAHLKRLNINCELVTEFAKDKVWEGNKKIFTDQLYIFGKQHWKLYRCLGEVDVVITDSPLLLSIVYNSIYGDYTHFDDLVIEAYNRFDNRNFMITRSKPYNPLGRNQTEQEARGIDMITRQTLSHYCFPVTEVGYDEAEETIVQTVLHHLEMH